MSQRSILGKHCVCGRISSNNKSITAPTIEEKKSKSKKSEVKKKVRQFSEIKDCNMNIITVCIYFIKNGFYYSLDVIVKPPIFIFTIKLQYIYLE